MSQTYQKRRRSSNHPCQWCPNSPQFQQRRERMVFTAESACLLFSWNVSQMSSIFRTYGQSSSFVDYRIHQLIHIYKSRTVDIWMEKFTRMISGRKLWGQISIYSASWSGCYVSQRRIHYSVVSDFKFTPKVQNPVAACKIDPEKQPADSAS